MGLPLNTRNLPPDQVERIVAAYQQVPPEHDFKVSPICRVPVEVPASIVFMRGPVRVEVPITTYEFRAHDVWGEILLITFDGVLVDVVSAK